MTDTESLVRTCAAAAADKKAENIEVLDLRGISTFTDFFIVCSGNSDPHLKAIASGIRTGVREAFGTGPFAEDGAPSSRWIILDYAQVIVHVFNAEAREFYSLEDLWGDAPRLKVDQA